MGGDDIDGGADGAPPAIVGGGEMDGGFDGAGETVVLWPPVVVGMGETEGGFDGAGDAVVFSARSRFPSLEDRPRSNSTAAAVFDDKDDLPSFPFWPCSVIEHGIDSLLIGMLEENLYNWFKGNSPRGD